MTINSIYDALDNGKTVHWCNDNYEVEVVSYERGINKHSKLSLRGSVALRVTCISNGFGSLISKGDLNKCYVRESV